MENDRYMETQKRKKKDVICEAIFKGTLRLGVQDFKPWCKVKIKMRLEVSLRNQSRCFGDVLNASQKLWVAEWTFSSSASCTASVTQSPSIALWISQVSRRTEKPVDNCFSPLTLLSGLNILKHSPYLTRDAYSYLSLYYLCLSCI